MMAGDEETVEAHFFGKTSMAVLESVDAFARKTGLSLVEARLVGTLPLDQECHKVTFRVPPAGGPSSSPAAPPEGAGTGGDTARERWGEKIKEFQRKMQDPEVRRRFAMSDWELLAERIEDALEERVGSRLDRLLEADLEIAGLLKGAAEGEPPQRPVNLPEGPMLLGRVAGTEVPFEWDPMDLKTHCLIAGQEGSGTSTAASVIVEEALRNRVPVLCFDPTGWWTGLLRPSRDPETVKSHPRSGVKIEDARPFNGTIHEITDPSARIDLKKHLRRGEVTIFTLDKLRPGELDQAVMNIVDTVLRTQWKESIDLEVLLVFDEVHRLLEKHGGRGGYVALETGAREFRKWGIGMVMVGGAASDFREVLRSNTLMEVQFRTRNPADIDRIKTRFGEEYGGVVPKLETGEALVAHPKYNRGKPITVRFRPPRHGSGKLPEKDLETHRTFAAGLEGAERALAGLRKKGVDTAELELEVNLVRSKVAEGRFRMAEVYLESLRTSMERFEGKGAARRRGPAPGARRGK